MPAFLVRVNIAGRSVFLPYIGPRQGNSCFLPLSFRSRGAHVIEAINISSVFPFNFIIRKRDAGRILSAVVFPKPLTSATGYAQREILPQSGQEDLVRKGYEPEVLSVRDYTAGDALKYIHWKKSARTGDLKTKEMAAAVHQPLVIDFADIKMDDLERKLSLITFLILSALKKNTPVGLKIYRKYHAPAASKRHKILMLTDLALFSYERYANKD
jgi:uncharacterized protein (DUF58 family)